MLPLPAEAFVAARVEQPTADSLSLVRFDTNDYSVPTAYAHRQVTAVGTVDAVRIVAGDRVVAEHRRCWGRERVSYDPVHYLALLERKPGALDFAAPLAGWELPVCFGVLRRRLEAEFGGPGTRQFIKVLRLLEWASPRELTRAVERALELGDGRRRRGAADPGAPAGAAGGPVLPRRPAAPEAGGRPGPRPLGLREPDGGGGAMSKTETKSTVLLKHHLKALKLPTMHRRVREGGRAGAPRRTSITSASCSSSASGSCSSGSGGRPQRRLKAARFPTVKTLEAFDFAAAPTLNKPLVLELLRCEFLERRENLLLVGGPGTGKTHLATALGVEACGRGKRVRFYRVTELVTQLLEAREERQLGRLKSQLAKLDLLILDELGYVPASKAGAELLFDVIGTAYERTSVVVTTNLPFEQWPEVLGSERLTGAALDRLTHRCQILETGGESYRLRDAKRRRRSPAGEPASPEGVTPQSIDSKPPGK